ncbi:MAG UNVERIFIED_CONTAM: hypothetical protein LVT10_23365 [Anaerolineae bacterium]|jgi:seryl-tRNA synthetase
MIDIALIRSNPSWVKEQMLLLQDTEAEQRIDRVVELDSRRRELLTLAETLQSSRNKLNKSMGGLRGNKTLSDAHKSALMHAATQAIQHGNYEQADAYLAGNGARHPHTQRRRRTICHERPCCQSQRNGRPLRSLSR